MANSLTVVLKHKCLLIIRDSRVPRNVLFSSCGLMGGAQSQRCVKDRWFGHARLSQQRVPKAMWEQSRDLRNRPDVEPIQVQLFVGSIMRCRRYDRHGHPRSFSMPVTTTTPNPIAITCSSSRDASAACGLLLVAFYLPSSARGKLPGRRTERTSLTCRSSIRSYTWSSSA
jgi:hypothetical protein